MTFFINNKIFLFNLLLMLLFFGSLSSCNDELFTEDPAKTLSFSTDTLTFDTVFTSYGSTTEKILVYNPHNRALNISSIELANGANSMFRLNVDGEENAENTFRDIKISAKDSMYVFVEVTVNPNNTDSPVLIEDAIVFNTNGKSQSVTLEAFGQDVILMKNKLILNDSTLKAGKPYLVYGYLAVDSAKTLTLEPGCRLYFHNNANMMVYGNLIADGTFDKPITLRGDRLDKLKYKDTEESQYVYVPYNYIAGQWGGLYLLWKNGNHSLKHVNITSGYVGIYYVNTDRSTLPMLTITNCRLHNFVYYGLVAQNGNVQVNNSEISNTGSYSVYLNGGKHEFLQSTIANFYNSNRFEPTSRDKGPAVMIMGLNRSAIMETVFKNCVITGGQANELSIATRFLADINADFSHNFIRRKTNYELSQFKNTVWYEEKDSILFKTQRYDDLKNKYYNFMPDSLSAIRGIADPAVAQQFPVDLNGNNRLVDGSPDAGAYEWIPLQY